MSKKPELHQDDPETTGHEWDGIQEFNNPLPRWWLWTFYVTIFWAVAYSIAYPAWPMVHGATAGLLGWSTRANVAADIAAVDEANAAINTRLAETGLTEIADDPELQAYAVNAGQAVFNTWCVQCHQTGAKGAVGYPNLLDDAWLWGGDIEAIAYSIRHGIRNLDDPDARYAEMPAFGDDYLSDDEIAQVVAYVMTLSPVSRDAADMALAADGETVFADNCASCHMEDGTGDRAQGAPNLTDAIWLYGSDQAEIETSVRNGPFGVMPAWGLRLDEAEVKAVAAFVHQLGGGE